MKPTDILSSEHRVIEQVLDCLEAMVRQCTSGGGLDEQPARDAVAFFRNYADRYHHAKEEAHFFPAMEAKGFPRDGGPTGVMLQEHETGRSRVRGMDEAIGAAAGGDERALARFVENARAYIELLRQHIHKEDHCLFSMADDAFSEADQRELSASFEKVRREGIDEKAYQEYIQIAGDLAERYGVLSVAAPSDAKEVHPRGGGCGS